jgi:hypothetical protein
MSAGQYKRIYNIAFILLMLGTFIFVYWGSKNLITTAIENADLNQHEKTWYPETLNSYDALNRYNAEERRLDFCKNNLGLLSTIASLLAYTATYFLVWYSGCLCVRYVKKAPK